MRAFLLALPLLAACATERAFLAIDPAFQPNPRASPVDVCILHKPSAPYRIVGTLRVEASPDDEAIEVQRLALIEAARVGCELLVAPQLVSSNQLQFPFLLTHGGEDHGGGGPSTGPGSGPGTGPTQGPTQGSDSRGSTNPGGSSRDANRRVVHEFGCGLYRVDKVTDA
jgi:hypothetical protein